MFGVPGVSSSRLGHRHQEVFVEIVADADGRGADTPVKQPHRLRDNLVRTRHTDVGQAVSDQQHAVDAVIQQVLADLQAAPHPRFMQRRGSSGLNSRQQLFQTRFVFGQLARRQDIYLVIEDHNAHSITRQQLIDAVHDNLRNLGLEKLDVVNLRVGEVLKPMEGSIEEPLTVLAELKRQGLIRHLGLSNVTRDQFAEAQAITEIVCVQNLCNMAHRHDDGFIR